MEEPVQIDSMEFKVENAELVRAGEDFRAYTRPYKESMNADITIFLNGQEIEISNKIDLVDTAKAQYEMLRKLREEKRYSDLALCGANGYRQSIPIEWNWGRNKSKFNLFLENNMGERIGDCRYSVPIDVIEKAVTDLLEVVIGFMESKGIEELEWAERKEISEDMRKNWANLQEFKDFREELSCEKPQNVEY